MIIGVPKEISSGERRVSLIPAAVRALVDKGNEVRVEAGAGERSSCSNEAYEQAGAGIETDARSLFQSAELTVKVQPPTTDEVDQLREATTLLATLQPFANPETIKRLASRRIAAFSFDLMPRITRAQSMDVLSSMSTVAGYRAVLIAANSLPKFFPMLMTAAGTIRPARVLVLGAGVAGLQAIATARRLGAVVEAFDIRAAVKEQIESLGARFVEQEVTEDAEDASGYAREQTQAQLAEQQKLLSKHIATADAVICTALVPGRQAPVLMSAEQVKGMQPGSVIVDLAAEQGGNCELTRAGEVIDSHGVQIHGPVNLPGSMPVHASQMYSKNASSYLLHLIQDGELKLDLEDELTRGPLVTRDGAIVHDAVREAVNP